MGQVASYEWHWRIDNYGPLDKMVNIRPVTVDYPVGLFNIELTNRCPMKCVMCPRTRNMTRDLGDMAYDLFAKVIDELLSENPDYRGIHPVWLHHFGESLLHPEFDRFIKYAASRGVSTGLSINPIMLKNDINVRLISSGLNMLYISLDGHDDESFYRIRGVHGGYQKSYDNVLKFLDLKNQGRCKLTVTLSMIDMALNEESIEKTKSYWSQVDGIDNVLIKNFTTWNGSAEDVNMLAGRDHVRHDETDPVACAFPWERMTVMWDGSVVPCCNDYDKKLMLGNVRDESLAEIWNGKRMQSLRQEFNSNHVTNPLCQKCDKLRLPREKWRW